MYDYVVSKGGIVVGNPGVNTDGGYIDATTILNIFEGHGDNYPSWTPAPWTGDHTPSSFSNMIHEVSDVSTAEDYVDLARSRNVGWIYITNDVLPNPWDTLPGYWDQLVEICKGKDNNCDGVINEGFHWGETCTVGKGICESAGLNMCSADGLSTDCGAVEEGLPSDEVCNDLDNNCNGNSDEGCNDDNDGYCDSNMTVIGTPTSCPSGGGDCDDEVAEINPGATEICDDIDNNCVNDVDEGCDDDKDDYCDSNMTVVGTPASCPSGGGDCDDDPVTGPDINPRATEVCDGIDNNCVDGVDEGGDVLCDDSQWCNGSETCDGSNGCQSGTSPDCGDNVSCTEDSCDEVNDQCVNTANNAHCDDGVDCTNDSCNPVNDCQNVADDTNCDDGFGCTNDSCDPVNDCQNVADDAYCDDGQNQLCDICDTEDTAAAAAADGCVVDILDCINLDIPVGEDITRPDPAIPGFDFSIWFEEVTTAGTATVLDNWPNSDPFPEKFSLCGNYFDIVLTGVVFNGWIEVCAPYDPNLVQQGDNVYLMHFVNGQWEVLDSTVGTNPDRVCGLTTSLSPLAPATTPCTDADGDGFFDQAGCGNEVDCDDTKANINPEATEICDGQVDNDLTPHDNNIQAGVCAGSVQSCDGANGWMDDYSAVSDYEATEVTCDGLDNNCDGQTDEGFPSEEVCDGIDNDCDGEIDENLPNNVQNGDVNGDNAITPQDALMAFQHYLGIIELSQCQQAHADVNQDSSITPADALCVFQKYLGLDSCLD